MAAVQPWLISYSLCWSWSLTPSWSTLSCSRVSSVHTFLHVTTQSTSRLVYGKASPLLPVLKLERWCFRHWDCKVKVIFIWLPAIRQELMTFISLAFPVSCTVNGLLESIAKAPLTLINRLCVEFLVKSSLDRRPLVSVPVWNFTT